MSDHIENDLKVSLTEKSKLAKWVNDRLPIISMIEGIFSKHPYPKNLSYCGVLVQLLELL